MTRLRRQMACRLVSSAICGASLLPTSSFAAIIDCNSSPYVVDASTGNVTLSSGTIIRNTGTSGNCVELRDGRDLNLNGATIECTSTCGTAVEATSAGSILQGGTSNGGYISGAFLEATYGVEEVQRITFDGVYEGVDFASYGKRVSGNVFLNVTTSAVLMQPGPASSLSYVRDNYIVGASAGIVACGSTGSGPQIDHNYIRDVDYGISTEDCHIGSGNDYTRIFDNILGDVSIDSIINSGADAPTLTNNLCEDATDCPTPSAPFTMP